MCHTEATNAAVPRARREEVEIALSEGGALPGLLASPLDGPAETAPPVLVLPDMFGRSPFYEQLAGRLAEAGFRALLVDYFFRLPPVAEPTHEAGFARRRQLDERRSIEDLRAALTWLREQPGGAGAIGTVGFCMAGTFALDLAAVEHDLATVAFYGFPVPQPTLAFPPPAPLELAGRLHGPILALWGAEDAAVGPDNVERFVARMRQQGQDRFEHRIYPGVGHSFLAALGDPDASEHARTVAADAWDAALAHLRTHLR